jgi:HSP20 family protein
LRAERKLETNESNDKYRRIERSYGKFVRRFSLPETIDVEGIDANYKNGVLRLTLPKTELKDKGRTISVN